MKKKYFFIFFLLPLYVFAQSRLFSANNYSAIVITKNATQQEKYFAQILQKAVAKYYNKNYPIVTEKKDIGAIFLGSAANTTKANDNVNVVFKNANVYIYGKENKDLIYSIYTFLENYLGVYMLTPSVETSVKVNVKEQDYHYSPPFFYRQNWSYESNNSKEFNAVLRQDGDYPNDAVFGKQYTLFGFVHTFATLLPASKYYAQHPDWFLSAEQVKSKKKGFNDQEVQLCFNNKDAFNEFVKNLLLKIENNPSEKVFSVSQNDGGEFCECTACTASRSGNRSTQLLNFINKVASEIEKKHPEVLLETLFYADAIEPAAIQSNKNVIIRLALIGKEIGHPIEDNINTDKKRLIDAWAKISPTFFYWDYALNSHPIGFMMPQPGFGRMGQDLRYLRDKGTKGYFVQSIMGNNEMGFLSEMKSWVLSRLMWNPEQNQNELVRFFLQNYYGVASEDMYQLYTLVENSIRNEPLQTYQDSYPFLTHDVLEKAGDAVDRAISRAKTTELKNRVTKQKIIVDFANLYLFKTINLQNKFNNKKTASSTDFENIKKRMLHNIQQVDLKLETKKAITDQVQKLLIGEVSTKNDNVIVLDEDEFQIYNDPNIAGIKTDSGRKVAYLNGNNLLWGISVWFAKYVPLLKDKNWTITAKLRMTLTLKKKDIMLNVGIYNIDRKTNTLVKNFPVENFVGKDYVSLTLPAVQLTDKDQLWFYVDGNCNCIDQLLVDYIELKPSN